MSGLSKVRRNLFSSAFIAMAVATGASQRLAAHEAGDWILRLGLASADPVASSSVFHSSALGPLPGTGVDVGKDVQAGVNLVYMVSNNIGLELLASTPFEHDLEAKGLGFTDLGSTRHLPPTVTVNYFFGKGNSSLRPYLGVGINYTTFFSEELSSAAHQALGIRGLQLEDSWGVAWRGGIDWKISDRWLVNASFWKIDLETEASALSLLDGGLGRVSADVSVDPWVYMLSLGLKF